MAHRPSSRALVTVAIAGGLLVSGCGGDGDGDDAATTAATANPSTTAGFEIDESLPLSQRAASLTGIDIASVDVEGTVLQVTMPDNATVSDAEVDCHAVELVLTDTEGAELHYPDGDHLCE
ncbi:MAG: hypothetical protein S0880_32120 [Actinomycetota bacterium]|nr:hypothetical protein [Actinomycetota bacterium]